MPALFSFLATYPFAFHPPVRPNHQEFLADMRLFTPPWPCTYFYFIGNTSYPCSHLAAVSWSPFKSLQWFHLLRSLSQTTSHCPSRQTCSAPPLHGLHIWDVFLLLPIDALFLCLSLLLECTILLWARRSVYPALAQVWHYDWHGI